MYEVAFNPRRAKEFLVQEQIISDVTVESIWSPEQAEMLRASGFDIDAAVSTMKVEGMKVTKYKAIGFCKSKSLAKKISTDVESFQIAS